MAGEARVGAMGSRGSHVSLWCDEEMSGHRQREMGRGGNLPPTVGGGWRRWLGWGVVADGKAGGGGR